MPALTVTNASSTIATCVNSDDGSVASIFLNPSQSKTVQLTPLQFEHMAPVVMAMKTAGLITYSVAKNTSIDTALDTGAPEVFATMSASVSAEQTGTGSSQNVAHNLGVIPTLVLAIPTSVSTTWACTYGTHTTSNAVVTVTSGGKFKILAIA